MTPTRKIDRKALPRAGRRRSPEEEAIEPRDDLEATLGEIWSERPRPLVGRCEPELLRPRRLLAPGDAGVRPDRGAHRAPLADCRRSSMRPPSPSWPTPSAARTGATSGRRWCPSSGRAPKPPFFYVAPYQISVLQFANLGDELAPDQPAVRLPAPGPRRPAAGPRADRGDGRALHHGDEVGAAARALRHRRPLRRRVGGVRDGPPAGGGGRGAARRWCWSTRARRGADQPRHPSVRLPRQPHALLPPRRTLPARAHVEAAHRHRSPPRAPGRPARRPATSRRCGPCTARPSATTRRGHDRATTSF